MNFSVSVELSPRKENTNEKQPLKIKKQNVWRFNCYTNADFKNGLNELPLLTDLKLRFAKSLTVGGSIIVHGWSPDLQV